MAPKTAIPKAAFVSKKRIVAWLELGCDASAQLGSGYSLCKSGIAQCDIWRRGYLGRRANWPDTDDADANVTRGAAGPRWAYGSREVEYAVANRCGDLRIRVPPPEAGHMDVDVLHPVGTRCLLGGLFSVTDSHPQGQYKEKGRRECRGDGRTS